jgi:hypothetical protein
MVHVALVGCSKLKREGTHRARDLYKSPLFRKSLVYAEYVSKHVYILSARYDLLELNREVSDYDEHLGDKPTDVRLAWAMRIIDELVEKHGCSLKITLLAGHLYTRPIKQALRASACRWTINEPMQGLSVGERLRWLNERTDLEPF